jgi:ABC-type branched-subunit amino acid transport system substrate-binding protein
MMRVTAPAKPPQSPAPPASPPAAVAATPLPPPAGAGPVKVALLVPLSGPNADLGKSMLEAAQLALFQTGNDQLTLVPRDTGGTPDGAANAARAVIGEGAKLILGPLLAGEVDAVKVPAREASVPVLAFSTATQLAGGNIFLMGFLPKQEVVREVAFARERGLNRFAALAPNTAYGHLMGEALRDTAASAGATVVKVEYFDPRGGDVATIVKRLVPSSASPAPPGPGNVASAPVPLGQDFDALLLPEGGDVLKQIAKQVRQAGLDADHVRLLGSGLWDDPSIGGEPALNGGWFASSPPEARRDFENRFRKTYGHPPPRLASLAFDGAALAAALAKSGGADPFSQDAIQNPRGFSGVDGLFRFAPDGLVQRGLAVLEVGPQGTSGVSPAPSSFADIGY